MRTLILALLLMTVPLLAQNTSQLDNGQVGRTTERARLEKTYTNYTGTTADTSGFFTINTPGWVSDPLLCPQVRLIGVATDSVVADVYVIGTNGTLPTQIKVTYADSIKGTDNALNTAVITLRALGTDRLAGCTRFKVGTVMRTTGNGTTTGRTMKWYLQWVLW